MTTTTAPQPSRSIPVHTTTRTVGVLLALAGAALLAGMVFAPWLTPGSRSAGEVLTGWDLHEAATGSQWYIRNFFDARFSPILLALPMFVAAGLVTIGSLAIWFGSRPEGAATRVLAGLIGLSAVVVALVNPMSLLATGPGSALITFGWGMIGIVVGGVLAGIGLMISTSPTR